MPWHARAVERERKGLEIHRKGKRFLGLCWQLGWGLLCHLLCMEGLLVRLGGVATLKASTVVVTAVSLICWLGDVSVMHED